MDEAVKKLYDALKLQAFSIEHAKSDFKNEAPNKTDEQKLINIFVEDRLLSLLTDLIITIDDLYQVHNSDDSAFLELLTEGNKVVA